MVIDWAFCLYTALLLVCISAQSPEATQIQTKCCSSCHNHHATWHNHVNTDWPAKKASCCCTLKISVQNFSSSDPLFTRCKPSRPNNFFFWKCLLIKSAFCTVLGWLDALMAGFRLSLVQKSPRTQLWVLTQTGFKCYRGIDSLECCLNVLERQLRKMLSTHHWDDVPQPRAAGWGESSLTHVKKGVLLSSQVKLDSISFAQVFSPMVMRQETTGGLRAIGTSTAQPGA